MPMRRKARFPRFLLRSRAAECLMRLPLILISILVGLIVGFSTTTYTANRGMLFDAQQINGWIFVPRIGAAEIDPYRRAHLFHEGELPLASGEGFALRATQDRDGVSLHGDCRYELTGPVPNARFWTLVLNAPGGPTFSHPTERTSFTSAEIIRTHDKPFVIAIGPEPLAGNWLPSRKGHPFVLIFRFYEPPLSASATELEPRMMPQLKRLGCGS